ncbi:MAG: TonB-dependent receptor plug domain-containing protein, partial [Gemmatimonadota bacterium]
MRACLRFLAIALLLALPMAASAQQARRVVGQVQDNARNPLAGVQVTVLGTSVGTLTNSDGHFALEAPAGADSIQFVYIGYRTVVRAIAPVVNVTMRVEAVALEGIVVTALGIEREQRTIPYAAQSISGGSVADVPTPNLASSLQGNVAGIHVTNSSTPFGSARIIVRGASSILGQNQPLIIVDGIPIDNSTPTVGGYGGSGATGGDMRGYNVGNAAADIDPNNVQSITVLKGPNAAALYGSAAANGAIVITTKKGAGPAGEAGFGLTATIGSQFETPLMLPAYQNQYGQGAYGEFNFVDGNGGGTYDFYDESWGPMLDGRTTGCVFQRDAAGNTINDSNGHPLYDNGVACNQFNGPGPWIAHPNNVRNFFRTGMLNTVNVAVSRSSDLSNLRLSIGRTDESGMYPNNRNMRTDINLSGGAQVSNKLSTEAAIDYINSGINGAPKQSYDESDPMQTFIWFGRQVDIAYLKNHMFRDPNNPLTQQIIAGNSWLNTSAPIPYSWNYSYHDNPYWQAEMRSQNFARNRLLGHASATYKFNDWLNVTGRVGRDWYSNHLRADYPVNTVDGSYRLGAFDVVGETRNQTTYDVLFNGKRQLMSDLNLNVSAGGSIWKADYNSGHNDVTQLVIPGVYTMENSAGQPTATVYMSKKQVNSLYASASFNYRDWFNVDVTGRNDWSSTLPKTHNSYFYPSVGAAF